MATPIHGFQSIGKFMGEMGRALNNQKCKSLKNCTEMYKNFGIVFQRYKIKKYISTMPKRCQQVIKNKRYYFKYQ